MKKTIITIAALFALMATPALVSATEVSAADKAKAGISSAADWTVSASKKLWNMTKQGAEDFKAWSEENKKHKAPAKWTRVKTDKGWRIVRTDQTAI
ncbi:MAG: hypothetical protein Q9M17_03045 [Mariprofundus sp.]|nr:hypothetical protein [Mariprofundus sp.]